MMKNRLIAVIVVRDGKVVQSEQFQHNHVIHYDAIHAVHSFSSWDVDEIVILNVSRDPRTKNQYLDIIEHVSSECFVPLTVGGFIEDEQYGAELINRGADKMIINSAFQFNPKLPFLLSNRFGRQCITSSIDVKNFKEEKRVFTNRGQFDTGVNLSDWIRHCETNGAGEFFLNNIQHDGMRKGYDLDALDIAVRNTNKPIIIFGGAAIDKHFSDGLDHGASAVAAANMFHYKELATKHIKRAMVRHGHNMRKQS